jgi:hypothetical protein
MKGTIVCCLRDLIVEKFGKDKWENSLEGAGMPKTQTFMAIQDIDDGAVMTVVQSVTKVLGITLEQAADAFGDYWVNVYAKKVYSTYLNKHTTAKSLLLAMDDVHVQMTKSMANAKPPRFAYEWKNEKTLIMTYKSHRGLLVFLSGLVKGVGRYYNEKLTVSKAASDKLQIVFP